MIENQINGAGNLNFDPAKGQAVAPWLSWGPYQWADGVNPRSDGFVRLPSGEGSTLPTRACACARASGTGLHRGGQFLGTLLVASYYGVAATIIAASFARAFS